MINIAKTKKDGEELVSINGLNDDGKILYKFVKYENKVYLEVYLQDELKNKEFLEAVVHDKNLRDFVGGKRTRLLARILKDYIKDCMDFASSDRKGKELYSYASDECIVSIANNIELVLRDEEDGLTGIKDLEFDDYKGV